MRFVCTADAHDYLINQCGYVTVKEEHLPFTPRKGSKYYENLLGNIVEERDGIVEFLNEETSL